MTDDDTVHADPRTAIAAAIAAEVHGAAAWCAARGHAGNDDDPLPTLLSEHAAAFIAADRAGFRTMVLDAAGARAIEQMEWGRGDSSPF